MKSQLQNPVLSQPPRQATPSELASPGAYVTAPVAEAATVRLRHQKEEPEEETKKHLTQKEYSALVSFACFSAVVLMIIGIVAYKVVRICLHAG